MLRAEALTVAFGGVRALDGVDLDVRRGELLGVIGPNGCGKTTLLNALTGVVPAHGSLELDDRRVPLGDPTASTRAGISRVFQAPQLFESLSVLENVAVGSRDRRATSLAAALVARPLMWRRERERWRRALDALDRVGVRDLVEAEVGALSYGNRRLVELARAVCADPTVLLLDEPSAGLNDSETDLLGVLLAELNAQGLTIVMVDHKIDFVDRVCHRIVVMETGRAIAQGSPAEVWADPRVVDAYLGVSDAPGG